MQHNGKGLCRRLSLTHTLSPRPLAHTLSRLEPLGYLAAVKRLRLDTMLYKPRTCKYRAIYC